MPGIAIYARRLATLRPDAPELDREGAGPTLRGEVPSPAARESEL
jgi:hypothetical protein